jgi:L-ascorbate metabolism protein UlaG (beta-lactamase superfamily)
MPDQLIKPLLKDEALLEDIRKVSSEQEAFHLWWLGQSSFLIQWQGKHLLIDPYLSDSLTKKYAHTDKPHIRMTELVIDPARLDFIDIVTSSHNHTDHLDADTLIPLMKKNPELKLIIPEANRSFVTNRIGSKMNFPIGLNDGEQVIINGFSVTAVPAAHETIERDERGQCKFLGYIFQYGPYTLYHSGDTMWYEGMEEILASFKIDVAILPINGKDPNRKVAGNLNAREAASLGKIINARTVIPCHYNMFTFNTADPEDLIREAEIIGQPYDVLQAGEKWSSIKLKE